MRIFHYLNNVSFDSSYSWKLPHNNFHNSYEYMRDYNQFSIHVDNVSCFFIFYEMILLINKYSNDVELHD